jgi:hypothetical protein
MFDYTIPVYSYRKRGTNDSLPFWFQSPQRLAEDGDMNMIVRQCGGNRDNHVTWKPASELCHDERRPGPSYTEAHGVLIRADPERRHKCGDLIWIHSNENLVAGRTTVPIFNLSTFCDGEVPIADVAWKPDMRQAGRLLTMAGAMQIRSLPRKTEIRTAILQSTDDLGAVEIREIHRDGLRHFWEIKDPHHKRELFHERVKLLLSSMIDKPTTQMTLPKLDRIESRTTVSSKVTKPRSRKPTRNVGPPCESPLN